MLSLILAILTSALVSITMRVSENRVQNNIALLVCNYVVCVLITGAGTLSSGWSALGGPLFLTAGLGLLCGVFYLSTFLLLQMNIQRNGVVLSSTFMKLGLLVSMILSVVVYREMPTPAQILGFCLAVLAIVLINYQKGEKTAAGYKLGLLWLLLSGGMGDSMSKIFEETGLMRLETQFLFFTFLMALVLSTALMCVKRQKPGVKEWLYGTLIAIPNYYSCKFLLGALEAIPAVIVYPVYSVGAILVVTLTGVLAFRERLTKQQWLAIGIILAALVLLNI